MQKQENQPAARVSASTGAAPVCHFAPMKYEAADNGNACVEHWWECAHCGHTKEIGTETIGA